MQIQSAQLPRHLIRVIPLCFFDAQCTIHQSPLACKIGTSSSAQVRHSNARHEFGTDSAQTQHSSSFTCKLHQIVVAVSTNKTLDAARRAPLCRDRSLGPEVSQEPCWRSSDLCSGRLWDISPCGFCCETLNISPDSECNVQSTISLFSMFIR